MAPQRRPDSDLAQQDVLQAVVLADSFAENFRPITFERPKMLLPLVNVPMIEYTLEFLAAGGVQEVFVFCCSHSEEVQRYIRETELQRRLATLRLHVLVAAGSCYSVGDALRQIEARGVITSDFVLVPGDVVSNLQLAPLIAQHKARRELDKDAVLTTLMKKIPPTHKSRRVGEEKLVVLSGETGRLLLYEDLAKWRVAHKLRLPTALLTETDQLELYTDLYDTHIDICVPELLTLLQDNFDWQDLRRDFMPGVLGQFEMLGKTIYTHVVTSEYAARVHDPHTYDAVSRDVIQRWAYPFVPDANLTAGSYRYCRGNVYQEDGVMLSRSSLVDSDTVIGAGSVAGEGAIIRSSMIGRGCKIGAGAQLEGAYLWADVVVGEGAILTSCICCDGVVIEAGAIIPAGAVLAKGCCVAAGHALAGFARFSTVAAEDMEAYEDEDEDEESEDEVVEGAVERLALTGADLEIDATAPLGVGGEGWLWKVVHNASSIGFERRIAEGPIEEEASEADDEEEEMLDGEDADAFEEQAALALRI